ncbi:hypothetical protein RB595_010300 [Gaeumannomyces hyphopodioides]
MAFRVKHQKQTRHRDTEGGEGSPARQPRTHTTPPAKMNQIRAIQALNRKEIEQGISPEASWHVDYRDTAYVYFGGLPYELTEGDVVTIFSQFGEPVFLKLVRDRETGKSKGFGWLKYEDQRSTDLAVDNLGGAEIASRLVRVDHARYKPHEDDDPDEGRVGWQDLLRKQGRDEDGDGNGDGTGSEGSGADDDGDRPSRPLLREEQELAALVEGHDDDDPMKAFLIEEKKKEVEEARAREQHKRGSGRKDRDGSRHRHHKRRRHRDEDRDRDRSREKRPRRHHRRKDDDGTDDEAAAADGRKRSGRRGGQDGGDDGSRDRGRRREDREDADKRRRRERSGEDRRRRDRDEDDGRERGRDRRSDRDGDDRDRSMRGSRSAERRRRRSRSRERKSRSRSRSKPRRDR